MEDFAEHIRAAVCKDIIKEEEEGGMLEPVRSSRSYFILKASVTLFVKASFAIHLHI